VEFVEYQSPKVVRADSDDSARALDGREVKILQQIKTLLLPAKLNIWLQIKVKKRS